MLKEIKKDILTIESGIICHQVNCQGVMGAGIAKAIRDKWPTVYSKYKEYCDMRPISDLTCLGVCKIVTVNENPFLSVANIFGQFDYGRDINKVYTDYAAINGAFLTLSSANDNNFKVYVPYRMGCGLANGNWDIYQSIIEKHIPDAIVCRLD